MLHQTVDTTFGPLFILAGNTYIPVASELESLWAQTLRAIRTMVIATPLTELTAATIDVLAYAKVLRKQRPTAFRRVDTIDGDQLITLLSFYTTTVSMRAS